MMTTHPGELACMVGALHDPGSLLREHVILTQDAAERCVQAAETASSCASRPLERSHAHAWLASAELDFAIAEMHCAASGRHRHADEALGKAWLTLTSAREALRRDS